MGETVQAPATVPDLPAVETTFALPYHYELWMSLAAKRAGLILGLVPVAVFVAIFLMVASFEGTDCGYSDGCEWILGGFWSLVYFVIGLVGLLALATVISRIGNNSLSNVARTKFMPRLQSFKDWYVRGDITEGEFEQLRAMVEPVVEGNTPALKAQRAVRVVRTYSIILSVLAPFIAFFSFLIAFDIEEIPIIFILLIMNGLAAWLLLTGWRSVLRARDVTQGLDAQINKRIDTLETEILKTAHARRRVPGSGPAAPYGPGPSFRPYGGR